VDPMSSSGSLHHLLSGVRHRFDESQTPIYQRSLSLAAMGLHKECAVQDLHKNVPVPVLFSISRVPLLLLNASLPSLFAAGTRLQDLRSG
jgi:hypothetical protein